MLETTPTSEEPKKDKPSPSAQILNNVELLVAMCEEQERAAAAASRPADTSAMEAAVEKSVKAAVDDTVANAVQAAISEALSDSIEKIFENYFGLFEKRISQVDDRINQVDDKLNKLDTNVQSFNARFNSLNEKIDSAPPQTDLAIDAKSQFISQLDSIGSDLAGVVLKFDEKFASLERTFQDQCKIVNGFHTKFGVPTEEKSEADTGSNPESIPEPQIDDNESATAADDSASTNDSTLNWQQQKQAMLAQYGGHSNQQPLDQTIANVAAEKPAGNYSDAPSKPATDSSKTASDSSEIEQLKQRLNAKLREAEVELSINRARLSQERAEFERNQADLERRSTKLEAKLAAMDSESDDGEDGDIMSRFKRHLGS